jgi:hypothetical protein
VTVTVPTYLHGADYDGASAARAPHAVHEAVLAGGKRHVEACDVVVLDLPAGQ